MSYYVIDQTTNELLYVSDFEPPQSYASAGHHIYDSPITASEIEQKYDWSSEFNTFVLKSNVQLTKRMFIKRFTATEYSTIKTAAAANSTLDYYWQLFMLADYIDLTDPDTISGVSMLETVGLLAPGRAQEILNG